ncbi:MAG: rhodanese-like domain-containing protein [Alphaproteobacteria bacterium]|nr:rhodanese-like domain-containing protein [Alphaproteobacteria bacterium]
MSENYSAISAEALREALEGEGELAVIDFREEGSFAPAHLLHACNVPLSRLELEIRALVPLMATRIVATDNGGGLAERGAARLRELGYGNVVLFANGVEAWRRAGYEVFSGFNVPSKAFGEYVEHAYDTPSVSAEELRDMLEGPDPVVVLDSRPMDEFRNMNIPTGICCPGAELVYRVHDLAPSPETTVIVNCAGRTRSIIGAQSLINAGIPNRVAALRNGTMGWHLAGLELERGNERPAPNPSAAGLQAARGCARAVAERFEVPVVSAIPPAPDRTTYVFDVRHPHEFEAGHLKGSRSAPGGQLVQATDRYAAVRGARIFLVDDNGVRAAMTAHWLRQMNWEATVLEGALEGGALETGPGDCDIPGLADVPTVGPEAVEGAVVVDFADSKTYAEGHIPGAWFAIRSRLASARLPDSDRYVFTSPDGRLAHLAAGDFDRPVAVLEGGTQAWTGPLEGGALHMADTADDVWLKPYEQAGTVEENMQAYLDWETGLVEQLDRDGTTRFWSRPA